MVGQKTAKQLKQVAEVVKPCRCDGAYKLGTCTVQRLVIKAVVEVGGVRNQGPGAKMELRGGC